MFQATPLKAVNAVGNNWKIARSFPRFGISAPLQISAPKLEAPILGKIVDISLGGLCGCFESGPLQTGDRMTLEFQLPTKMTVTIPSKLRYCSGDRNGFRFISITLAQREYIREACRNLPIV